MGTQVERHDAFSPIQNCTLKESSHDPDHNPECLKFAKPGSAFLEEMQERLEREG